MKVLLLCLTQSSWKLLLHKYLIMHSNRWNSPAGIWKLLFVCNYLIWRVETTLGRQWCLNWEMFVDVSPCLPLPHLTFGCLSSSLHENVHFPTQLRTIVYSHVQMHKVGGSGKCVHLFWDIVKGKQEQDWFSSCYHSHSFFSEGSFSLGDLWGRGSILLFQSCLLFKVHLLRVFQGGIWLCFHRRCWILADVLQLIMMDFLYAETYYSSYRRLATYWRYWVKFSIPIR